jgi:hypothetical protein
MVMHSSYLPLIKSSVVPLGAQGFADAEKCKKPLVLVILLR